MAIGESLNWTTGKRKKNVIILWMSVLFGEGEQKADIVLTPFQSIYYNGKAPGVEFQLDVAGDFI